MDETLDLRMAHSVNICNASQRPRASLAVALILSLVLPTVTANDWYYTIAPGDNLWNLADQYLIDVSYWRELQKINHVSDPWNLPPGDTLKIPVRWLRHEPTQARVSEVKGQVQQYGPGGGQARAVTVGMELNGGDAIETTRDANVTLEFQDGSRLLLQSDGQLQLRDIRRYSAPGVISTQIHVDRGRVETKVVPHPTGANRFEISTPAAVTSVRGTDFRVEAAGDGELARSEVEHGKVSVAGERGERLVPGGYGTRVAKGRPPAPPVPLLPPPDLTALPAVFERAPVHFQLPLPKGAQGYRLQVAADESFATLLFDGTTSSDQLRAAELPDGRYWLRVRAIDGNGLEGLNAQQAFTLNARPEPPFAVQPKPDGAVVDSHPVVEWTRSSGIDSYRVQVAKDAGFKKILDDATLTDVRHGVGPELGLGGYFWRVAAIDPAEGAGPFSDPQPFRRVNQPPTVEDPDVTDTSAVIRWRAGLPGQTYHVQLAEDEEFTTPLVDAKTREPRHEMPKPEGGTYYLRVKTIDPDGYEGPFSSAQEVDIPGDDEYWWLLALPLFALFAI